MNSISVFVDSDAFIALAKPDDHNHKTAIALLNKITEWPVIFVTSNYVFSECVTVLSQRVGKPAAEQFIELLRGEGVTYSIRMVDETIEQNAIELFQAMKSKNVSFVDCTNIAIMQHDGIDSIFSFDKVYAQNGLTTASKKFS